jgi:hypothetical protein
VFSYPYTDREPVQRQCGCETPQHEEKAGTSFTDVSRSWRKADEAFRFLRDRLNRTHHWRFGPSRRPMELRQLRALTNGHVAWDDVHFLDIGCGIQHPLGISTLAIGLGVASCFATDLEPLADEQRSAEATADLISFLLLDPVGALGKPCRRQTSSAVHEILRHPRPRGAAAERPAQESRLYHGR